GKTTVVRCLLEILPQGALGRDFGPEEIVAAVRASNQAGLACMLDLLIGGFFLMAPATADQSYNYNQNLRLVKAIRRGYRGAYWHILRQIG
ncbi:MAG: hypothetical protein H5T99_00795, partial [Moorella sp. (in: Bacteria)]|nr:hypothetical protein [Moorella sp. (in: firmicutes)]